MSTKRYSLNHSIHSSDQLAKMTCEDAYNWYNKPAAYCSYVDQRFDLEGKVLNVKDCFEVYFREKKTISDFRKTVGQLERDYVKGIIDVDGNPCDESQFNWRNFCAGADLNSISLLLFCLGRIS